MNIFDRRRSRLLAVAALVASIAGLGAVSETQVASATGAGATSEAEATSVTSTSVGVDPEAAVTYQQNPAHDGSYVDSSFVDPLRRSWSVDLGGTVGYPVIADNRVFVPVAHERAYGDDVVALSLSSGEVLWGPTSIGGTYHSGMLAYDDGRVFAINHDGRLTAFDASTGTEEWVSQLPEQYSFTSPPTAVAGTVFVLGAGSGGTLYAVDEVTGRVKWASEVPHGGDHSSPTVGNGGVFVSSVCQHTYRVDLDGTEAWHHGGDCSGGGGRTTVLHEGDLYVRDPGIDGNLVLEAGTGAVLGSFTSDAAPAFSGDYMATQTQGVVEVWDSASGTKLWSSLTSDNVTAPLIANGFVVTGRANGTVDLLHVEDGTLAWSGSAGTLIERVDEHNANKLVGLAAGDGALAVPAGTRLSVFVPAGDPRVTISDGPGPQQIVGPHVHFRFRSNVTDAEYVCTLDGVTSPCASPVSYSDLQTGRHTFSVAVSGSGAASGSREFTVDNSPPVVRLHRFHPIVTRGALVSSRWSATDAQGVETSEVRVRRAPRGTPLPEWTQRKPTSSSSATFRLRRGSRLCVAVRAKDVIGNWSDWTTAQCVVRVRR